MIDIEKFVPLGPLQFVELCQPADKTSGGVYLPEILQENYCEAKILRCGSGWHVPEEERYAISWVQKDWRVIFQRHAYTPLHRGSKLGFVRDEDCLGTIVNDTLRPLNDWVKVSLEEVEKFVGNVIVVPEEYQRRPRKGKVLDWGPGALIQRGELIGCRLTIPTRLQLSPGEFAGGMVYWGPDAECVELGREGVECAFVRADDLDGIEESSHHE